MQTKGKAITVHMPAKARARQAGRHHGVRHLVAEDRSRKEAAK